MQLKRLKELKILFNLLFPSIIEPLMFNYCLGVDILSNKQWLLLVVECLNSNIDLMMLLVAIVFWVVIYHWVFADVSESE